MSLALFIRKWTHPDYPPEPVEAGALAEVERHFGAALSDAYKREVLAHGLPRPRRALLTSIVDRELDIHDVENFYNPAEIIEFTRGWRSAGMAEDLIAFASDCMGNQHCFRLSKGILQKEIVVRPEIWFFDHDLVEVDLEASDFDAWINRYCEIEPVPEE
jgi:SMI1 / KNR4 family (SUKH-1)